MSKKPKNLYTLLRVVLFPKRIVNGIQHSIQLISKHFIQLLGPAVIRETDVHELLIDHHLVHHWFDQTVQVTRDGFGRCAAWPGRPVVQRAPKLRPGRRGGSRLVWLRTAICSLASE